MILKEVVDLIYTHTRPEGGCLVTTRARDPNGYGAQKFNGIKYGAHVLVARYYLGPCPDGQEVRHMCGRGHAGCVTATHLQYGTHKDNVKDAIRHGTHFRVKYSPPIGTPNYSARKLSDDQVRWVRQQHKNGRNTRDIGAEIGLSHTSIARIIRGVSYQNVKDPE